MMTLLLILGFLVLQGSVLFIAIGSYVHERYFSYYAALYAPVLVFAVMLNLGGDDDWMAVLIVQVSFSLVYNLHISNSNRESS